MRKPKERIIFDNYDIEEIWSEEAKNNFSANGKENPSEEQLWNEMAFLSYNWWNQVEMDLSFFCLCSTWIMVGVNARWNGKFATGTVFEDFTKMFNKAAEDCDYWKIWDENGHLYFQCSHHDGTNLYEIKRVTEKGEAYLENWKNNWDDERSEEYIHKKIMEKYSVLPRYAETELGLPKREYEREVS